jgi:pseudoazurin
MKRYLSILGLATVLGVLAAAPSAGAAEHEVKMLNRGTAGGTMVFEPAFLQIAPGDTVRFVPTDRGHDVKTIEGMLPEGAAALDSGMSQELVVTFETEGVYGYKCVPHQAMGMVGLVVVGDPAANLDAARAVTHRGRATQTFADLFAQLDQQLAAGQ